MADIVNEVVGYINQFNIPGWLDVTVDKVKVTKISGGLTNTTLKVAKVNEDASTQMTGPKCLVVKKYGGNVVSEKSDDKPNSPLIQSLIFYEMSKRGWGPKLYGLFDGGRIEELVDCHTLTAKEACDPQIARDLAKAYARFHSLNIPICQYPFDIVSYVLTTIDKARKPLTQFLASHANISSEVRQSLQMQHDFAYKDEAQWLQKILPKIKRRTVLCTLDPNFNNRLIRNEEPNDPEVTRSIIIDFDACCYADRGLDLGGHFVFKIFDWTSGNDSPGYPSEEERVNFFSAYLKASSKLIHDFDPNELDTVENLMREAHVSSLVYIILVMIGLMKMFCMLDDAPNMWRIIQPLLQLYRKLKQDLKVKYPHLMP